MKIVFVSDTHNRFDQVIPDIPPCDVLVHCGDMTGRGYEFEISDYFEQVTDLKERGYIDNFVGIAGNHDWLFETSNLRARELVPDWYNYLENSSVEIDGVKFYGSPVTPTFFDWAFNVDRGADIKRYWDNIPTDTDVLVTHGPPMGILDLAVRDNLHVGCEELLTAVNEIKPKVHAFGHVHFDHGVYEGVHTKFVNASNLGESYEYVNKPIVVEL